MSRCRFLLGCLILLVAAPLSAEGDLRAGNARPHRQAQGNVAQAGLPQALLRKLGLSAGQLAKIKALQQKQEKTIASLRRQLRAKFEELEALLEAENISMKAVRKKAEEIGALRTELMLKRIETTLALRQILTKEQSAKLRAFKKEQRRRREGPARRR